MKKSLLTHYLIASLLSLLLSSPRTSFADAGGLISLGDANSCAVTSAGGLKCWGINLDGSLGEGSINGPVPLPVDVIGLSSGVSSVALFGVSSYAVVAGIANSWGNNASGQLGSDAGSRRSIAAAIPGLASGITNIAAGGGFACALTSGGGVQCLGRNNSGQLGDNSTVDRNTPADVSGLTSGVSMIATGFEHACALISGGVKCWGYNADGELGDTTLTQRLTPVDVAGLTSGVLSISAGYYHTCAVLSDNSVRCWGYNAFGQLGNNSTFSSATNVPVANLSSGIAQVASGENHSCALTLTGGVKCWGRNIYGEMGDGTINARRDIPVDVVGLTSGAEAIACGADHTCALTTIGGVKCWGRNDYAQLGNNSTIDSSTPVDVINFDPTPTPTPTSTPTATATFTATPTATPTATTTPTPTSTSTPPLTATPSPTLTSAPIATTTPNLPDLVIQSVTISDSTLKVRQSVNLTMKVANIGLGNSLPFKSNWYLSRDKLLDTDSDIPLGSKNVAELLAGQSKNLSLSKNISTSIKSGKYWLFGIADSKNVVVENNEDNNSKRGQQVSVRRF